MRHFTKTYYKRAKTGKVCHWTIEVFDADSEHEFPVIVTTSGFVGFKTRTKRTYVKKGTNIGKSNEKSPLEMAIFKAKNKAKEKWEDNMVETIDEVDLPPKFIYPMLAEKFNPKKLPMRFFVQPKLDGCRLVSFAHLGDYRMLSRKRKEFTSLDDRIKVAVRDIFGIQYSPDGECHCPGESLQTQMSWVKKLQENTKKLDYYVYDLAMPDKTFEERYKILKQLIPEDHSVVKLVPTYEVDVRDQLKEFNHLPKKEFQAKIAEFATIELKKLHDKFVQDGYEGAIIRFPDGMYGFNDRPIWLMKYKCFEDDEFEIVDYDVEEYDDPETGDIWELVVWTCETADGVRFNARPRGSFVKRREALKTADEFVGEMYTVRYQTLTDSGVPQFPVGIVFRNYE